MAFSTASQCSQSTPHPAVAANSAQTFEAIEAKSSRMSAGCESLMKQ